MLRAPPRHAPHTAPPDAARRRPTKLASSARIPAQLLDLVAPCLAQLDDLVRSLQLRFAPDAPPRPLPDVAPLLLVPLAAIAVVGFIMKRFFNRYQGQGGGRGDPYGPIDGNDAADPYRAEDVLQIKHGQNEYLFKYPVNTIARHELTVGHVREKCHEITGVAYERLTLICAGQKLTNDNATLKSLGVEHGAKILLMGSNQPPAPAPKNKGSSASLRPSPAPEPKRPTTPMDIIEGCREEVTSKLLPLVDDFIQNLPEEVSKREDAHRRLSETIMKELLKLDAVESPEPEIRARRKEVVREIQNTLDRLDRALRDSGLAA